jgi:alpha-ketoglutarate-dependent 2,4-dichlorophenoxyacetate dioxygenase
MSVSIRALANDFAGEVLGIDAGKALTADEVAALEAGMDAYAVLVLHDQHINDAQQMAFSANFGPLLEGSNATVRRAELRLDPAFADVSNIARDGSLLAADDRRRIASLGNRLWHSDASFRVIPARYSLLSAREVPPQGGNTEFADMRAAYDALDADTRAKIADLICEHSQIYSRAQLGFTDYLAHERETMAPVLQRLVREHPATGRRSLYLSAHIGTIVGWQAPEAMAFIRDLIEHATQREFVHAHSWRAGDLVIWDNRCTMHRVRSFDDLRYRRDLRRTTTRAEGPTVEQQAA